MRTEELVVRQAEEVGAGLSIWRILWGVLLLLVVIAGALGYVVWRWPLAVVDQVAQVRLWHTGVRSASVTVDGHRIHYLVGGAGEPLVLVHGLGGRALDWSTLGPQFIAGGHRIYALDLLGYGDSDRPLDASYSIAQEARVVEHFIDAVGLRRVDLAGWSMGGWIALRVAADEPQRIARLVVYSSAGLRFPFAHDASLFTPDTPAGLNALQALLAPNARPMPDFIANDVLRRNQGVSWVVHRSAVSMLTGADLMDGKLGGLTMPVMIGWGRLDWLIPLSVAYRMHAEIPQSVLEVYPGCGHLAPILCGDRVGRTTVEFLNAEPARRAEVRQVGREKAGNGD